MADGVRRVVEFGMMIAREGWREILVATVVLGALAALASLVSAYAVAPFALIWIWAVSFFRDPPRRRTFAPGDLCSAADGRVTEISELEHHDAINQPAIRIGVFLSIFNVHINRAPCSGRVRSIEYRPGEFLDARHPESGRRNESNTLLIDADAPLPGPVEVRQVAGWVARRIVCRAHVNDSVRIGERFGLIKFGSRTELILPRLPGTEVLVRVGDRVRAGLTIVARQPVVPAASQADESRGGRKAPRAEAIGVRS